MQYLSSKFTKCRFSAEHRSDLLGELTTLPQTAYRLHELSGCFVTEKGGKGRKEKEGGKRRTRAIPRTKIVSTALSLPTAQERAALHQQNKCEINGVAMV